MISVYRLSDGDEANRQNMLHILEMLVECVDHTDFDKSNLASMCQEDLEVFIHYVFDSGFDPQDRGAFNHRTYGYEKE